MDAKIIAQKRKDRYHRALKLVESEAVSSNGQPHQFYVRSGSGNGRYLAATPKAIPPIGTCTCKDFTGTRQCKHVLAAEIYEKAEATAKEWAAKHCLSYSRLGDKLLHDLNCGMVEPLATKVTIVFHACLRLARKEEMTGPMELAQVRHSIVKALGGIREIHEQLRDNPDNRVAQEQLKGLRATLNNLNAQEARMLLAYH